MEQWQCCRTCLRVQNLNLIFYQSEHHEKYSDIIFSATGVMVAPNDSLPQLMCTTCINFINESYKFRKKCEESQKSLLQQSQQKPLYEIKIEPSYYKSDIITTIDISDLIIDNDFREYDDNITLSEYNIEIEKTETLIDDKNQATEIFIDIPKLKTKNTKAQDRPVKKRGRTKKENQEEKRTKEKKERVKEEIECEMCHKVLTSKLSLRNHYKIHTGFDVVCEHCGKKFITRRLLLMHCKAKHGYEKTDKCSFCDYKASNAEQVKIHERLHTGEKPYVCAECGVGFHRKSSYLQHIAIHLPDKTVQCELCPLRFKSVTLMRIHRSRHRPPQYSYSCRVCEHTFARRRNVVRHLSRQHSLTDTKHINRTKCV